MHALTNSGRVAVIGGGPAGIITAKELLEAGLEPVVLEQSSGLGGQWNAGSDHSSVWPGMHANTSGAMTRFSEHPAPADWPLFPRAEDVRDHLVEYAERFGVAQRVRHGVRVTAAVPVRGGWEVEVVDLASGAATCEHFAAVVGCSGRFVAPSRPELGPLDGRVDVSHASEYRGRDVFRGQRVLVIGNSISGLEIAADLAADPAITVISSARRGRWIIPKVTRGVPSDQQWFTAFSDLLGRTLSPQELADGLREALRAEVGDPAAFGGLTPHPDLLACGLTQCQQYLPLVAEGRIDVRPGLDRIDGDAVLFADGTSCAIDAIVLATGYDVSLPYVDVDPDALVLHTIDAEREGLALMGQYVLHGPYFPVLELQARWLAAVWTGRADVADAPALPPQPHRVHHQLAGAFAQAAGLTPDADAHPELAQALMFGPMLPERYRLDDPATRERFAAATAGFVAPPEQVALLDVLTVGSPR